MEIIIWVINGLRIFVEINIIYKRVVWWCGCVGKKKFDRNDGRDLDKRPGRRGKLKDKNNEH